MTLGENLLSKFIETTVNGPNCLVIDEPSQNWSLTLEIQARDSFGCRLSSLTLRRRSGKSDTRAWAEAVAQRVHGLLEPLELLEFDAEREEALLRSDRPTIRRGEREHFELRLKNGNWAELKRYRAPLDPTAKKQPTTFDLTNDLLAKLIDDLTTEAR
jgi:hypothetical protein